MTIEVDIKGTAGVLPEVDTPDGFTPNKERLREWVAALRSGKFTQTKEVLHSFMDGGYCCLGVACVVAKTQGLSIDLHRTFNPMADQNLPSDVAEWFGLLERDEFDEVDRDASADPKLAEVPNRWGTPEMRTAAWLNDDGGWTFEQLADAIEKKYNLQDA